MQLSRRPIRNHANLSVRRISRILLMFPSVNGKYYGISAGLRWYCGYEHSRSTGPPHVTGGSKRSGPGEPGNHRESRSNLVGTAVGSATSFGLPQALLEKAHQSAENQPLGSQMNLTSVSCHTGTLEIYPELRGLLRGVWVHGRGLPGQGAFSLPRMCNTWYQKYLHPFRVSFPKEH